MQAKSDAQLLRDYADHGHEAAFREIVTRHTDLVYSAAWRQLESADLAADVAQSVFVDLARKAKSVGDRLAADASLVGWLYRSTRFAALTRLRDDRRRAAHERLAMEQLLTNSESPPAWEHVRPLLDEALDGLSNDDREAVLLRYFKKHDLRTVGATLGISDDAAQKRVSRAVEHLREFFAKHGITAGASGLTVVIAANSVQAAPVGLAAAISAAALAGTAASTATIVAATAKTLVMTTLQKTLITATVAVLAGVGIYEARQAARQRIENQTLHEQLADALGETGLLSNHLVEVRDSQKLTDEQFRELLRLRGEVGTLRRQARELVGLSDQAPQFHAAASDRQATPSQQGQEQSAQPTNQVVYVAGLVHSPGRLVWTNGMNLKSAIECAGGFTGTPDTPNTIRITAEDRPGMTFSGFEGSTPTSFEPFESIIISPNDHIYSFRLEGGLALPTVPEGNVSLSDK